MPLLSDGDLAAAFTTARPALRLRLDVRPAADCEQLGVGEGSWRAPRLALTVPPPSPCRPAAEAQPRESRPAAEPSLAAVAAAAALCTESGNPSAASVRAGALRICWFPMGVAQNFQTELHGADDGSSFQTSLLLL